MFRLIKFAWTYFRLYRCNVRLEKNKKELPLLEGKINAIQMALTKGYSSEVKFAKQMAKLVEPVDKYRDMMVDRKEINKRIILKEDN